MKKEEKEIFKGVPCLRRAFLHLKRKMETLDVGEELVLEELKERQRKLLSLARTLSEEDLYVIYYVHRIKEMRPFYVVQWLKQISDGLDDIERAAEESKKNKNS